MAKDTDIRTTVYLDIEMGAFRSDKIQGAINRELRKIGETPSFERIRKKDRVVGAKLSVPPEKTNQLIEGLTKTLPQTAQITRVGDIGRILNSSSINTTENLRNISKQLQSTNVDFSSLSNVFKAFDIEHLENEIERLTLLGKKVPITTLKQYTQKKGMEPKDAFNYLTYHTIRNRAIEQQERIDKEQTAHERAVSAEQRQREIERKRQKQKQLEKLTAEKQIKDAIKARRAPSPRALDIYKEHGLPGANKIDKQFARLEKFSGLQKTFHGLGRQMLGLNMSALGMSFSMMSVFAIMQQGIMSLLNPLDKLEDGLKGMGMALAFGGDQIRSLISTHMDVENYVDSWMKFQGLKGAFQSLLVVVGSKLMDSGFFENIVSVINSLFDVLTDDKFIRTIRSFIEELLSALPDIIEFVSVLVSIFNSFNNMMKSVGISAGKLMAILGITALLVMPFLALANAIMAIATGIMSLITWVQGLNVQLSVTAFLVSLIAPIATILGVLGAVSLMAPRVGAADYRGMEGLPYDIERDNIPGTPKDVEWFENFNLESPFGLITALPIDWNKIAVDYANWWAENVQPIVDAIGAQIENLVNWFGDKLGPIADIISTVWDAFVKTISEIDIEKTVIDFIINPLSTAWETFIKFLNNLQILEPLIRIANQLSQGITNIINRAIEVINNIPFVAIESMSAPQFSASGLGETGPSSVNITINDQTSRGINATAVSRSANRFGRSAFG